MNNLKINYIWVMRALLFLFFFIPLISTSQDYKNYKGVQMCLAIQTYGFSSDTDAEEALDMIMDVSGLNKNFILSPCENINNALAIRFNNERYIIYDPEFMSKIDGKAKWRNLTILAHEVAHHLNNHPVDVALENNEISNFEKRKKQELEADEYAGFIMHKLGAPIDDVMKAISSIAFDGDDTYRTHPNRDKRINAIKAGYKKSGYNENILVSYWEKFKKTFLTKSETKKEDVKPTKKTTSTKKFKLTARDFYIDRFNKNPDYGNYIDVSSSYFTNSILYSRTTEVLNEYTHSRYGKLKEGISYVNKRIQIDAGPTDYDHRAELYFYLGKYREALSDINKAISLEDNIFLKNMNLEMRSKIKYMLGDYNGAIKDLEDHNRYSSSRNYYCGINDYYWFAVYFLAIEDYSSASNYLNRIQSFPNSNFNCGPKTISIRKSKAQRLRDYLN